MKKLLLIAMMLSCGIAFGQTTIDFEVADDGYSASATEGTSGTSTDIFNRSNPNIGGNSTFIWAIEDTNVTPATLTLDQIDVTGRSNFVFSIDFLTPNTDDWDGSDEFNVTYSIDGGTYQNLMWVRSIETDGDGTNEPAALDLDFDGSGEVGEELPAIVDGHGAGVGSSFATFSTSPISLSSNSTLDISIEVVSLSATAEGIYFDNIEVSFDAAGDPEPSNHVTSFTATANGPSQIDITWSDNDGSNAADGFLILASTGTITSPTDGIDPSTDSDLSDGSASVQVDSGIEMYSFTGLAPSTSYNFEIYPYSNAGSLIDFKTDATVPSETESTTASPYNDGDVIITEIMYNSDGNDEEWIEIYNASGSSINLDANWSLSSTSVSWTYDFDGALTVAAGDYATIQLGSSGAFPFTPDHVRSSSSNQINNSASTISLLYSAVTIDEVAYDDGDDSRTDNDGPSYEIIDLTADNSTTASNWQASAVDGGSPGAFSSVTVWDGSTDSDWSDASNWSNGVPDNTTNAIIPDVTTDPVIAAGTEGACNDLTINASASLTISSGGSLAIFDRATNNGTYTVEKAVTGSAGYSILGAPVSDATINDLSLADYIVGYDNSDDSWPVPDGTASMSEGVGFFVGYDETSPTVSFTGTPNDGNVTYTVSETSGFELVANPYAAAITVADFLTDNTIITGGVYLWDDGGANIGGDRVGDYIAVTGVGAASAVDPTGQTNSFTGDDSPADDGFIASVQGFFLEVNNSGTLTFSADHQTFADGSNDESDHYRSVEFKKVKLAIAGNNLYNEVLIGLGEGATFGVDRTLDAKKFVSGSPLSFYTLLENEKYVIQALPNVDLETISIPLGFDLAEEGTFTMSVVDLENIPENINVTVIDHLTGISHDLKTIEEFDFNSAIVENDQRFELQFSPVEVLSTDKLSDELSISGNASELQIQAQLNGDHQLTIYSLDGKVAIDELVTFKNNEVTIQHKLSLNNVYIMQLGEESLKFVIK